MGLFTRWMSRRSRQQVVADGLKQFGGYRDDLARWVLTGMVPSTGLEKTNPTAGGARPTDDEREAMMKVIDSADPLVEWRLGELFARAYSENPESFDPLFRLWLLRGSTWPSDSRIYSLVGVSELGREAFLRYALTGEPPYEEYLKANAGRVLAGFIKTGRGLADPMTELRKRPIVSELVWAFPEVAIAELRRSANAAPKVAAALSAVSPTALAPLGPTIAELASDKSKKRRQAGDELARVLPYDTLLPEFRRLVAEGDASTRAHAIRAWAQRAGDTHLPDVVEFVTAHCSDDRSAAVQQAIAELGTQPRTDPAGARPAFVSDDSETARQLTELAGKSPRKRARAAEELGRLHATAAMAALHQVVAIERDDLAFAAELRALDRLGESIESYVAPDSITARATKGLRKKTPKDAAWIQFDTLPTLEWSDGTSAGRDVADWLIVTAVREGRPDSQFLARAVFEQMEPATVHRFCSAVLEMWIAEDLAGAPEPSGSAIGSKGVLALVAAGGDESIVDPAAAYVREWYTRRAPQAKALVDMLGTTGYPDALQFLFRLTFDASTQDMRSTAFFDLQRVAERRGVRIDELACRITPTAGFDAAGRRTFRDGSNRLVAELTDELEIVSADGDRREQIDPAFPEVADAQQRVATAAEVQPRWLLDSMCVQREIGVDDFHRYIVGHPVMVRLGSRLVWAAAIDGRRVLFRPLSDGTLIDADGATVDIGTASHISLAHEVIDGVGSGRTWGSHFEQRGVRALFPQFDRPAVPSLVPRQSEIFDFEGATTDGRRLAEVLPRLSFRFGARHHNGVILVMKRRFGGVELEAWLEVTGLSAKNRNREVVIGSLTIRPYGSSFPTPLRDVPPVLLVETIAEVEQIVAAGDGSEPA